MSENGIEELAGLFTLPEVSASADTILAREQAKIAENNNDVESETKDSTPRVSPNAAEKMAENVNNGSAGNNAETRYAGDVDSDGTAFDPAIHATDSEGRPKKTKTGKWAKKRGRKSNSVGGSQTTPNRTSADIQAAEAGLATAQIIFTIGVALGGEEWQPEIDTETGKNEPHQMAQAWAEYYKATGIKDVPPWVTVAIACSCYALPRFSRPQTKTRLQRFSDWIKNAIKKRKKPAN